MKHSRGNTGTIRRVMEQLSIYLLLGAVVNVAVAGDLRACINE